MIEKIGDTLIKTLLKKESQRDSILKYFFKILKRDPLLFAYNNIGILNYKNEIESGEKYFISEVLPNLISMSKHSTFFDVGANKGQYSSMVASQFPNSYIYSFEPNPKTFSLLKKNTIKSKTIKPFNIGFSNEKKIAVLYDYANNQNNQHASLYKDVLSDLHQINNICEIRVELDTLDDFCKRNDIDIIDFIKIDTEGNELDVLKGGLDMIKKGKVNIIQFEFNEMNIVSKVFLKDFYSLLSEYKIFRLNKKNLIPLNKYSSTYEIFKYQNIVAIRN